MFKNIKQKVILPKQFNLQNQNINDRIAYNNYQNNIGETSINQKSYNPSKSSILTYEYNINNNRGIKQYINSPINNKILSNSINKYNNYINNSKDYINKPPINHNNYQYKYTYKSQEKSMPVGSSSFNKNPINMAGNKTPISRKNYINFLYQSPLNNLNKKQKETPKYSYNNYNTSYYSYLNNNLEKKYNMYNDIPIKNKNYHNIGNSQFFYDDIPSLNQDRYDNNNMRKTYIFSSNKLNNGNTKNFHNNVNKYHFNFQSLMNNRTPIIPQRTKIPLNNNNNILKNNRNSSPLSYFINKRYGNKKNIPVNQKQYFYMNKSQNQSNLNNRNYYINDNKNI